MPEIKQSRSAEETIARRMCKTAAVSKQIKRSRAVKACAAHFTMCI
jgi:hypothetical protein